MDKDKAREAARAQSMSDELWNDDVLQMALLTAPQIAAAIDELEKE